jgi:hypothetical protein
MQDKITALAAPPGNSLTGPPGKWPWEQPARFSDPDDAIDYITESISNGPSRQDMLKLMLAGITVEELVDQVAFKGFMAGAYTPDVAELIKPAVGIFLYDLALNEGFEPRMFVDEMESQGSVDDVAFFNIIKSRNPELFMAMNEERNRMTRMGDKFETQYEAEEEAPVSNSFLSTAPIQEEGE